MKFTLAEGEAYRVECDTFHLWTAAFNLAMALWMIVFITNWTIGLLASMGWFSAMVSSAVSSIRPHCKCPICVERKRRALANGEVEEK